ncbi:MAG: glycine zipper family protein, partial [Gaiellaceae bacterium]
MRHTYRSRSRVLLVSLALVVCGCSARRPVLYPNEQFNKVGDATAQHDIDDCLSRAEQYVKTGGQSGQTARQVGGRTAVGAGVGAASGAVGGAIAGNPGEGAAIGAASGATAGLLSGLFDSWGSHEVDPVYANFVDRCLRD